MYYQYSFLKKKYTVVLDLSFNPHVQVKKELQEGSSMFNKHQEIFSSDLTEFYIESNTIENIQSILRENWFSFSIESHIWLLEQFFLKSSEQYNRLYSFNLKLNEFTMYFCVTKFSLLTSLLSDLFQSDLLLSSINIHNFCYYWNTSAQFYFFKIKYKNGEIIPSIVFEFHRKDIDSFQVLVDYLKTKWNVNLNFQIETNLKQMFTLYTKSVMFTLNLQTGFIENIYFE